MEELIAARYNLWWYLSFFVPALVMIVGTFWHKKAILIVAITIYISKNQDPDLWRRILAERKTNI